MLSLTFYIIVLYQLGMHTLINCYRIEIGNLRQYPTLVKKPPGPPVYPCRDLSLSLIILTNICASRTPQATDSS